MIDLATTLSSLLLPHLPEATYQVCFNRPSQDGFGDLTTSTALETYKLLSPQLKNKYSQPRLWAAYLSAELEKHLPAELASLIERLEVAGPGFINIFFNKTAKIRLWQNNLTTLATPVKKRPQKVIVEFSSPNIAKSFTVGHLRSTIIGSTIANLLSSQGYQVIRDNHLGDWGTQFGKQVVAIEHWGDWQTIEQSSEPIRELVVLYVRFHEEAATHPELEDEARLVFTKMEQGDKKYLSMWQKIVDLSMKEFNQFYQEMQIVFDENDGKGYGESYFRDKMEVVVEQLRAKKLLKKSRGAWIVEFPSEDKLPPLMILKQDGSTLYATRDLATDYYRLQKYGKGLMVINEVGKEQSLYFKQLFALERLLGWYKQGERLHISHGLYRFHDRKMSTRKGDVVWLQDIVVEAKKKVVQLSKATLSQEDIGIIAWGAIKWNDLIREAKNDIDFDLSTMISLKGNSGTYLQYTCSRLLSVLEKAENKPLKRNSLKTLIDGSKLAKQIAEVDEQQWDESELTVIDKLNDYLSMRQQASDNYAPQILANYLFELALLANSYYAQQEIAKHAHRLLLTKAIIVVLADGLSILGIQIPSKM